MLMLQVPCYRCSVFVVQIEWSSAKELPLLVHFVNKATTCSDGSTAQNIQPDIELMQQTTKLDKQPLGTHLRAS